MENFLLSANAVAPMFLLMAAGYASRQAGILNREDRDDIFRVCLVACDREMAKLRMEE